MINDSFSELKAVKVFAKSSEFFGILVDLKKEDNSWKISPSKLKEKSGYYLTDTFLDLGARCGAPDKAEIEDFNSLTLCALKGGYSALSLMPDNCPACDNTAVIDYLKGKSGLNGVEIYPLALPYLNNKPGELSEINNLMSQGAVGFSNAHYPFSNLAMIERILQYINHQKRFYFYAEDSNLSNNSLVNESATTVHTGMKGNNYKSESLLIHNVLQIIKDKNYPIHFVNITCEESLNLIRKAKKDGLNVTCDVNIHHLVFSDDVYLHFDANYKQRPPFRTTKDLNALIEGVIDGSVDAIVSGHRPVSEEEKEMEFGFAKEGQIGLQFVLPIYATYLKTKIPLEVFINKITYNPREILNLKLNKTQNYNLINLEDEICIDETNNASLSKNHPLFGEKMKGNIVPISIP